MLCPSPIDTCQEVRGSKRLKRRENAASSNSASIRANSSGLRTMVWNVAHGCFGGQQFERREAGFEGRRR